MDRSRLTPPLGPRPAGPSPDRRSPRRVAADAALAEPQPASPPALGSRGSRLDRPACTRHGAPAPAAGRRGAVPEHAAVARAGTPPLDSTSESSARGDSPRTAGRSRYTGAGCPRTRPPGRAQGINSRGASGLRAKRNRRGQIAWPKLGSSRPDRVAYGRKGLAVAGFGSGLGLRPGHERLLALKETARPIESRAFPATAHFLGRLR